MTPCEKLGYKVGDLFEVTGEDAAGFTRGQIIELNRDDGTDIPMFKGKNSRYKCADYGEAEGAYFMLEDVKPLAKPKAEPLETFKCSFINPSSPKVKRKVSADPLVLDEVIKCFLEAYNNSGYCNKLSIVVHGGYEGDKMFTSNVAED